MATIYSTRFIGVHGGPSATYTVPAGSRAVIRNIVATNQSTTTAEYFQVNINPVGITPIQAYLPPFASGAAADWVSIDCRIVLNAGEWISTSQQADVHLVVSGYLFAD